MKIIELERRWERGPLGRFRLRPEKGLVGWAGGETRHRRAFLGLLRRITGVSTARPGGGEGPGPSALADEGVLRLVLGGEELVVYPGGRGGEGMEELCRRLGLSRTEFALLWGGWGEGEPSALLDLGVRVLARTRGLLRVEEGIRRLGGELAGPASGVRDELHGESEARHRSAELEEVERRLEALRDVPRRTRELEEEMRARRAEAAEVGGELEVETMEWLRERQDAETQLRTYRDRARELRGRIRELEESGPRSPCPYCGRPLGEHAEEVLAELRDEWNALVQDGRWWRRRREQLELKPASLQKLEGRSMRLQAEVERCAERLERARFDLREWDELRARTEELHAALEDPGDGTEEERAGGSDDPRTEGARRLLEEVRRKLVDSVRDEILRTAGIYLNRISGGRFLGVVEAGQGEVEPVEDGRRLTAPTAEEWASLQVALRLAVSIRARRQGVALGSLVLGEPFDGMEIAARLRTVELLRSLRDDFPQIFLVAGGAVSERAPDRFDAVVEVRTGPGGRGGRLRLLPGGVGRLLVHP